MLPNLSVSNFQHRSKRSNVRSGSRLCENASEPRTLRIVFSIALCQQHLPVRLVSAATKSRWKFYAQIQRLSFHTAWVKSCPDGPKPPLPVYSEQRTWSDRLGMSQRCQTRKLLAYSITRSAIIKRLGGISIPNAFAVWRFINSWNFVGCSIGKSAGLAPLKILLTKTAAVRKTSS